uniref:(E)-beta-farnesene synthase 1 n=1 Tax=Pseudotsuga menziesii TaxID=3357 RepID=F1C7P2_PSEMZ|nr:(E)-beta-farnesene synthase 1 [Pseudotsuga menziesii]
MSLEEFYPMATVSVPSTLPCALSTSSNSSSLVRRTANPHPNVWDYHFVQSLQSPYTDPCYGERVETLVAEIKAMLHGEGCSMITPSAYDTAWVARVPSIDGSARPQFPQTVEWILKNQLKDGSWGTESHFLLSDRLPATLSCVLALLKWKVGDLQVLQGIEFIKSTLEAIKDENDQDSLVTDFDIIFPSLLREAQYLDIELPYNLPYVSLLHTKRQERLANMSREEIHGVPSPLLYSLEGIEDMVDWERIMDVRSQDGSFLSSPASTACVFMHTGDIKCLEFLNNVLANFGTFVPCLYPVDLLERLLIVDNLVQLGIDRHFEKEIKEALDYVHRHWNERGIGWGRLNPIADLEITALGFRLLRLHRYNVSPAVFENFKDSNGHFVCSAAQFNKDVASMLSLYRASQLAFPGENILDEAKSFTSKYLKEALEKRETYSAWNNKQSLSEEIKYALENSWHASVPRVEAKRYCQVYRSDYTYLAKSVYKLPKVNNEKILELAKLDFNIIQAIHQKEMKNVTTWFKNSEFPLLPFGRERPVECFFIVAAGTYEPQYAKCRFLFSKVACLNTVLDDMYDTYGTLDELKLFTEAVRRWDLSLTENLPDYMKLCYKIFYDIVHEVVLEAEKEQGRELLTFFRKGWEEYLMGYYEEAEWLACEYMPSLEEYIRNGIISIGQRILVVSGVLLMEGQILSQEALEQLDYPGRRVLTELNSIITRLADDIHTYKAEKARGELASSIECYMKEHPGSTEEVAVNYMYSLLEPAVKELTWEFLKPEDSTVHIPFQCKKMLMEETRVTMVIFKEGDGFGISKTKIKDYIKDCLIEPLPL